MKRLLIPVLSSLLFLTACSNKQGLKEEETIRVEVEKATLSGSYAQLPYVGVVEEESSTMVSFTGMAMLKTITVSEGQNVRRGQLLATIDDTQARNALAAAKATLNQALDAQARMKQLHESNSISEMQWVEVESKVQQAQASYDLCEKNLKDCSIYAPCSGVVGNKVLGVGETVLPTEPVLTILSIDKVKVRVSIPEREIAGITSGTATQITVDALQGETFQGGRIEKGVSADPLTHTYDIHINLTNPEHKLLPGMVARVDMETNGESQEPKVTLPIKAVQQATDKSLFVWVAKDGKAYRKAVTIGQTTGNRVVITMGIKEGDPVIVQGYQKLGEGTPVTF